jgi:hypothetical protein
MAVFCRCLRSMIRKADRDRWLALTERADDAAMLPVDAVIFPEKPPVYFGKTMSGAFDTRIYLCHNN